MARVSGAFVLLFMCPVFLYLSSVIVPCSMYVTYGDVCVYVCVCIEPRRMIFFLLIVDGSCINGSVDEES